MQMFKSLFFFLFFFDKRINLAIPTTINLSRVANLQKSDFLTAPKYQIALIKNELHEKGIKLIK